MSSQAERDRPAPEDEIEVTEEMVRVGAETARLFGAGDPKEAAESIFLDMVSAMNKE